MDVIDVAQGTQGSWEIDLLDSFGEPISFADDDTLSAVIWAGDDTPDLGDPTAEWIDASQGQVRMTIDQSISAALDAGRYLIRLVVTSSGVDVEGWRGWLDVRYSPGSNSTTLSTYVSYQDLLLYAPQIQQLQLENDRAGFVEQRHLARTWFENILQNKYRGNRMISYTSPKIMSQYIYTNNNKWLQDQLDAGYLMVDSKVKEINAKRAISYIYDCAVSNDEKGQNAYRTLANKWMREASQLVKTLIAGLDLNSDGYAEVIIDCGKIDTRY